jgi:hypothetical protein
VTDLDLVAELAKKSGLLWIRTDTHAHPVWHEWVEDDDGVGAVYVVGGGDEQPLPDVADGSTVTLLLRSKSNRHVVASVDATVETVQPSSDRWEPVTTALKAGRLNLVDSDHAVERWARDSRVLRLVPHDTVVPASAMADHREGTYPRLS